MAKYTEESKMGDLLNDPAAVEVMEELLPGVSKNPMMGMAKGFSLKQLTGFPQANFSADMLATLLEKLEAKIG
jgi:hypothetical protein